MTREGRRAAVYAGSVALIAVAGWWSYGRGRFDGATLLVIIAALATIVALLVVDAGDQRADDIERFIDPARRDWTRR